MPLPGFLHTKALPHIIPAHFMQASRPWDFTAAGPMHGILIEYMIADNQAFPSVITAEMSPVSYIGHTG